MSDPNDRDNFCYRHPTRQSYILCQRCGRTICTECQTQAAVGVHCPECVKEARQSAPKQRPAATRFARAARTDSGIPVVTYSIIALCVVGFLANLVTGGLFNSLFAYFPSDTFSRPWTVITSMFSHGSWLHLLFNMYSLFVLGRILEPALGRVRFAALYFISGLGGSVAVLLLNPGFPVVGASGAIFGLLGALFIIQRHLGGNTAQLLIVIVLNLALGFFVGGISWQAHVGGVVTGAAIGLVYARTRNIRQRRLQASLTAGIAALLVVTAAVGFVLTFSYITY